MNLGTEPVGGLFIMEKRCAKCKVEKQLSEFNLRTIKGVKKPFSYCKACERANDKKKYSHTCPMCNRVYTSGRKGNEKCVECHKELMRQNKVMYKFKERDFKGEKNPMHGRQRFGKENPNYKSSKTDEEREKERLVEGYGIWRKQVYERDSYTCQSCGYDKGNILIAHHLDGWDWCKDKRLEVDNGITLCKPCHKKFHDRYGYGNNTKQQFITYMNEKECLA